MFDDSNEPSFTPSHTIASSGVTKASPKLSSVKWGRESLFGSGNTTLPPSPTKRSQVSPRKFIIVNGVKYYASCSPSPPVEATARRPSPFPLRLDSTSPVPHLASNSPATLPSSFPSAKPISVRAEPTIHTPSRRHVVVPRSRSSSYEIPDISEILQSNSHSSKSTPSPRKRIMFASPSALPPPPSAYSSPSGISPNSSSVSRSSVTKLSTAGCALRDLQIREAMNSEISPAQLPDAVNAPSGSNQCVSRFFPPIFQLILFSSQHGLLVCDPSTVGAFSDEGCLKPDLIDARLNTFYSLVINLLYVFMLAFLDYSIVDFAVVL